MRNSSKSKRGISNKGGGRKKKNEASGVKPAQNPLQEMFQNTERFGQVGKKIAANHKAIGSGPGIELTEGKRPVQLRERIAGTRNRQINGDRR
jgi:hypothetical protein